MSKDETPRLGLWILVAKFGAKLLPAIGKIVGMVFKTKGGLAALSFAGYSTVFTWQFAIVIMVALGIHEAGHVWAMRRAGIPTRGFYFIPFLGGAAVPDRAWHTQQEHLYVALMGPIWGTLVVLPLVVAFVLTRDVLWAGIAAWVAVVNLVNLLPIYPLDGGRVLHSVLLPSTSWKQYVGFIALTALMSVAMLFTGMSLFAVMGLVGVMELMLEKRKMERKAQLVVELARGRELLAEVEAQVESDFPGVFKRLDELKVEQLPDNPFDRVGRNFRDSFETLTKYPWVSEDPVGVIARRCSEDAYALEREECGDRECLPDLDDDELSDLRSPYEKLGLVWAAQVRGFQRGLDKLDTGPVLEGLTNPQRRLGMLCYLALAFILALLVVELGSVDGANAALRALQ
jgi:Zn-dependent protease